MAPPSGFEVVLPMLKSFGFQGSLYACDFGSLKTRKDWHPRRNDDC